MKHSALTTPTIGDHVIYRQNGIYQISDIRTEVFPHSDPAIYFVLTPLSGERTTVFLPQSRANDPAFLRAPLTREEILRAKEESAGKRLDWITDNRARGDTFKRMISEADPVKLLILYHTLCDKRKEDLKKKGKFGAVDERLLNEVRKTIFEEYTFVLRLTEDEVEEFITETQC